MALQIVSIQTYKRRQFWSARRSMTSYIGQRLSARRRVQWYGRVVVLVRRHVDALGSFGGRHLLIVKLAGLLPDVAQVRLPVIDSSPSFPWVAWPGMTSVNRARAASPPCRATR